MRLANMAAMFRLQAVVIPGRWLYRPQHRTQMLRLSTSTHSPMQAIARQRGTRPLLRAPLTPLLLLALLHCLPVQLLMRLGLSLQMLALHNLGQQLLAVLPALQLPLGGSQFLAGVRLAQLCHMLLHRLKLRLAGLHLKLPLLLVGDVGGVKLRLQLLVGCVGGVKVRLQLLVGGVGGVKLRLRLLVGGVGGDNHGCGCLQCAPALLPGDLQLADHPHTLAQLAGGVQQAACGT